jgi:hypothetical protein
MAAINATVGEHAVAVDLFRAAIGLDRYLAVAYVRSIVCDVYPRLFFSTDPLAFATLCSSRPASANTTSGALVSRCATLRRPCSICARTKICALAPSPLHQGSQLIALGSPLTTSNYEQIGLDFRLHAAEIRYNIGLSLLALGNRVRQRRLLGLGDTRATS